MKNLTFKAAMLNDSQPTVNRRSTDGQSQRHCKQTPLSKRWKVLMTLVFLFTLGIGNVWGATGDATTSAAPASGGTTKDYANTISVASGYVDGNVIYYISNNLTFISGWGIEANYLGIIFKPTVDLTLDFEGFNNNSNNVNITYQIDSIADAAFFDVFANAGDAKISDKIVADNGGGSAASNNVTLNYWKDNGVVKYSNKTWQSNGDNAPKNLAGQQNTTFFGNTRLVTNAVAAITSTKSTAAGSYSFMRGTKKFVFKAGKIYRIYAVRGSSKTGFKSFTFTPVYQLTWNFDEGASSETAGTDYTATGYYVKNATLAYPSDESMSKYGFVFDGWSSSATKMPASALTITAQWAALGSCVATAPGAITKGAASEGVLTLTAEGTPADNNTWYWQDAADGTATDKGSGATKNVNAAGTYYLRSFNDDGGSGCWSAAKSVTVAAEDLLTAITPNLSYDANVIVGNTLSPTLTGNAGNGTVVYTLNDVTPAGSLTINESTGVVTAVTAGGTATVTATIAANGNYAGNTATSGTITAFANPLGTHTITYTLSPINTSDASLTSTQVSTSTYLKNLTTIDASSCGFASSPSAGKNRTAKINRASSGKDNNKFVYLTFNVESGYQFTPTSIVIKVANVSNVTTFDAALISSDGPSVGEEEKSFSSTDGSVETWTIANEAGTALTGTVTLKIWPYANSAGSFRFGTPITITGTVAAEETKYDLSFAAGTGASGSMSTLKYAEGAEVTLPACTFTAPDSKEFDAWVVTKTASGDPVSVSAGKFTMPAEAVTATATWKAVTPKYHVTYDGNSKTSGSVPTDATAYEANAQVTVLGKGDLARIIDGNAATFYGWNTKADMTGTHYDAGANFNIQEADVTLYAEWGYSIEYKLNNGSWKSGYTAPDHYIYGKGVTLPTAENVERVGFEFDAWYSEWHVNNQGGYINDNKRTAVGPSDYGNASYLASWTALPLGNAQSVDLEGLVEDEGTGANWQAYMTSHGYEYSTESVSLDEKKDPSENKAYDNWPYQGLKMKKTGSYIQGTVEAGKLVVIKLGHMAAAATVTIGGVAQANATGLDAAEPAGKYNYYYVASESVLRLQTNSNDACVLKAITITAPYTVSFDVNGGDAAIASMTGTPSIILPTPTKGTETFLGWFVGENKIGEAGESYMPTADVELVAHWEAVSSDARLSAIEITPNTGVLAPAFNMELTEYTYTMPYGTGAVPTVTDATPNHEGATWYIESAATAWGETTIVRGKALSNDTKAYNITMLQAPKDGVAIISIDVPTGNGNEQTIAADNISGFIGGTATQKLQNGSKKLGSNGNYIGFTLANSEELQAGDVIRLNVSATNGASHLTLYQDGSDANLVKDIEWTATEGINLIPIPSEAVGLSTLYIYRKSSVCNPTLSNFAILRPMDPVLTAITIDGRDGEIDPQDDKHFNVTIPFEAELDNLTVVPTIAWNAPAAENSIVVNDGGAWVEGNNTYKLTDKDGDYTIYTLTLTRDVLKHAVKFYDGETLLETVEVEDGTQMAAGDVPADPTKEDYLFQGWAETDGGAVVDVTSFTISAAKNFYAKWVSDGAIKLIVDGTSGKELNTTNFLTGATLASSTVKVDNVDYAYATLGGTAGSPSNIDAANKVIAYHATTTQTKVMIDVFNTSNNSRPIKIMGVIEGSSDVTELATIDWPNSGDPRHIKTQYYEFNNTANRTIYITGTNTVSSVDFLQVKVIESGEQLKKAGEAGYSLNMNQGRLVGQSGLTIDGANIDLTSWYKPTNSTVAKLKETSIRFTVVNPVLLKVTAANNKEYYVTKGSAGTDNSTEKTGVSEFDLTAGTWYITAGGSEVQFTKIEFVAPKCEQPTIANMANSDLCEGDAFAELTVNASVNDEGTLHYAWYKEAGETDEAVGSDAATFTPEADGQYYVIVTNHKDNFTDNSKTSNTITVAHFASAQITTAPADQYKEAGQNATLTVAASGKAPLSYQWYTCDENGDNAVIIAGAEAESYQVAVTAGMSQYYKVIVGSGCGSAEAVAKVAEWTEKDPANVTGSMTWDWKSAAWNGITDNIEFKNTGVEQLMANVNAKVPCVDGENGFRSDMLYGTGQFVWRPNGSNDNRFFQGTKIRFITTVPGRVTVRYRNTSGSTNTRTIKITNNGEVLPADGTNTTNSFKNTNPVLVAPGEVIIEGIASETNGLTRIEKIVFNAQADEERNVVIGNMGTVCLPNPSRAFGVNVYELAGKGEGCKVQFDQLAANEVLEAGKAYVLVMTDTKAKFFYTSDETADADWSTAMKGNLSATPIEFQPYDEAAKNVVFFKDNAMWNAYETGLRIKQYRAYLQYDEVTEPANSQPAPGRRRVSLNLNGAQVATGFDNLETSEAPMKVMIDGQLFIIRGEKMFDATGRLVK